MIIKGLIQKMPLIFGQFNVTEVVTGEDGGMLGDLTNTVSSAGNSIVFILMMIGGFVGVIAVIVVGIKLSAGAPDTKASTKKELLPLFIGLFLIFAAIFIVGAVQTFSMAVFNGGNGL